MKKSSKKVTFNTSQYVFMLAGMVFFTGVALLFWFGWQRLFPGKSGDVVNDTQTGEQVIAAPCAARRKLDGACVDSAHEESGQLVAVMIENHVDARPQAGLSKASVVYEAPVEANITRFLALFDSKTGVKKVGPVRSARPYYLDWVSEYGTPMYMHVGGSPDALDKIDQFGVFDLNEFYRGWYFWRSDDRLAPHNAYTSSALWQKALADYPALYTKNSFESWKFAAIPLPNPPLRGEGSDDSTSSSSLADVITVSFAPPAYEAVWTYNASTTEYARFQMGRPHTDDDGTPIMASTVIVQRVKIKVLDAVGRREIATIGSGEALVFANGMVTRGTWKKDSRTGRTQWYNIDGKEIELAPGKIWIEIVGQDGSVVFD